MELKTREKLGKLFEKSKNSDEKLGKEALSPQTTLRSSFRALDCINETELN
jgi:hypothetical protein